MKIENNSKKTIALIISLCIILFFSKITASIIFFLAIGGLIIFMGIISQLRPVSFIGLILVIIVSGYNIKIETLLHFQMTLTVIFGLFIPIFSLTWITLSCEIEKTNLALKVYGKSIIFVIIYALICILSVPLSVSIIRFISPNFVIEISQLFEISIIIFATSLGLISLIIFTSKKESLKI